MKALGLNHWLGLPSTTGPVNAGFSEGRSGLRVSPSPERLEPICGVIGNPLSRVTMPLNCQPLTACRPIVRTAIRSAPDRLACCAAFKRRWAPVALTVVAVENHLRLVAGLRAGQRGIHVEILRPRVVGAEFAGRG